MTKKNWLFLLLLIALTAVYAVYFTSWFKPKVIRIFHTYRELHTRQERVGTLTSLNFGVDHVMLLTDVRVVPADGFETNKNILPLWHLVTDSNSAPVKAFFYGQSIPGMRPAIKGTHPEELETNVPYLLLVASGKIKGEHRFELK